MIHKIIIGSRGSALALFQSELVGKMLKKFFPPLSISIRNFVTTGDKLQSRALSKIGDKSLFTKELEDALLSGEIDIAVHSLKDMPTNLSENLTIGAYLKRDEFRDCLISKNDIALDKLRKGALIGTSSLRRKSQLKNFRPDLNTVDIRGNVETRIRKLGQGEMDAIILAAAGLNRLGLGEEITDIIPEYVMLPAVGQGIIAVEQKSGNTDIQIMLQNISDRYSESAAKAERALLSALEGGCRAPVGALATIENGKLNLAAYVGSVDGMKSIRASASGNRTDAEDIGRSLAQKMIKLGARDIIEEARRETA